MSKITFHYSGLPQPVENINCKKFIENIFKDLKKDHFISEDNYFEYAIFYEGNKIGYTVPILNYDDESISFISIYYNDTTYEGYHCELYYRTEYIKFVDCLDVEWIKYINKYPDLIRQYNKDPIICEKAIENMKDNNYRFVIVNNIEELISQFPKTITKYFKEAFIEMLNIKYENNNNRIKYNNDLITNGLTKKKCDKFNEQNNHWNNENIYFDKILEFLKKN